jgi:hypothetical protein
MVESRQYGAMEVSEDPMRASICVILLLAGCSKGDSLSSGSAAGTVASTPAVQRDTAMVYHHAAGRVAGSIFSEPGITKKSTRLSRRGDVVDSIIVVGHGVDSTIHVAAPIDTVWVPRRESAEIVRPDTADPIERVLARAKLGTAELMAPDTMRQGRLEHVRIHVIEQGRDSLPAPQAGLAIARDTVRVTQEMKAILIAPGFNVTAMGDSVQIVERGHGATWEYNVIPVGFGPKELTAVVSQHITLGTRTAHNDFPRTTLRVSVSVDPVGWGRVMVDAHGNDLWKWLTGGGLAAVVAWLVARWRELRGQPATGGGGKK